MIQINNLNKTYPDGTKALNGINLTLPCGMVGLLGPNGAGKSSLMRTIVGLQSADQGEVLLVKSGLQPQTNSANCLNDDSYVDVLQSPQKIRSTLGYLPQYFGVYPNMSCQALLKHMAILKGIAPSDYQQQIPELLVLTNLTKYANKAVNKFSGGMKQRFGIAQALLGNPSVVIMDEPTAGLDPEERERLHDMLISISKERLILLSTHIVEDVENLCQHSALLFSGEIKAAGAVSDLVETMSGRIWQLSGASEEIADLGSDQNLKAKPNTPLVLNKSFRFGEPVYRVYSETKPSMSAIETQATLQDVYFYARQGGVL